MKRLLTAVFLVLLSAPAWAQNATLNVTIPGSGTPLGFYKNASTYFPENVITNPLVPTQNWLIDSRGYGPMTEADGANVTLGSVADPVYPGSGSATAIGLLKGIYAVAAGPIVNFPTAVDAGFGTVGTSTIRTVLGSNTFTASCASPSDPLSCLAQIDVDIKSGVSNAGTPSAPAVTVQGNAASIPLNTKSGLRTLVALDISTVTTGGTAVTALNAGHASAGGFILNPSGATVSLCVNQVGTASGTTSAGSTICVSPGTQYNVVPSSGAVSVISSDSSHPFAGYGFQ